MKMLESKVGLRADRVLAMTAAAAAAATGAGLVGEASMASADIVYSGPVNINIPATFEGVYMDVVTGATNFGGAFAGYDINPWGTGTNFALWGAEAGTWLTDGNGVPGQLVWAPGTVVGAGGTYTRMGSGTIGPQIALNSPNYFGFRFVNESAANAINFGWMEITFGGTTGERAITAYAYENSGGSITIGAVPEPTSLSILALGALGLVARRRRRAM